MGGYGEVALIRCIDDAILVGGETISVGLPGSLITREGTGDLRKVPPHVRELVSRNQHFVYSALRKIMEHIDGVIYGSSHLGCAWADAHAITEVVGVTRHLCEQNDIHFAGHIVNNNSPKELEGASVKACITRPGIIHKHNADSIVATIGMGIKSSELRKLGLRQPFLVDVSYGLRAYYDGANYNDIVGLTAAFLDLADGIMDGNLNKTVKPFNGGRLTTDERKFAERVLEDAVDTIGGVIE